MRKIKKYNYKVVIVLLIVVLLYQSGILQKLDIPSILFSPIADTKSEVTDDLEVANDLEEAEYVRAVDGDTIIVLLNGNETRIRLLSVNTQESVSSEKEKNNIYGEMASDYTKNCLSQTDKVWLQYDKEREDMYDRTLAYVWLSSEVDVEKKEDVENYMLNAMLLKDGYANTVIYEPNHKYKNMFYEIEDSARNNSIGLWADEAFVKLVS